MILGRSPYTLLVLIWAKAAFGECNRVDSIKSCMPNASTSKSSKGRESAQTAAKMRGSMNDEPRLELLHTGQYRRPVAVVLFVVLDLAYVANRRR